MPWANAPGEVRQSGSAWLMLYPYAISETWLLYAVGALLSAALLIKSD